MLAVDYIKSGQGQIKSEDVMVSGHDITWCFQSLKGWMCSHHKKKEEEFKIKKDVALFWVALW